MTHFVQLENFVAKVTYLYDMAHRCEEAKMIANKILEDVAEMNIPIEKEEREAKKIMVNALPSMTFLVKPYVSKIEILQAKYDRSALVLEGRDFLKIQHEISLLPYNVVSENPDAEEYTERDIPRQAIRYLVGLISEY